MRRLSIKIYPPLKTLQIFCILGIHILCTPLLAKHCEDISNHGLGEALSCWRFYRPDGMEKNGNVNLQNVTQKGIGQSGDVLVIYKRDKSWTRPSNLTGESMRNLVDVEAVRVSNSGALLSNVAQAYHDPSTTAKSTIKVDQNYNLTLIGGSSKKMMDHVLLIDGQINFNQNVEVRIINSFMLSYSRTDLIIAKRNSTIKSKSFWLENGGFAASGISFEQGSHLHLNGGTIMSLREVAPNGSNGSTTGIRKGSTFNIAGDVSVYAPTTLYAETLKISGQKPTNGGDNTITSRLWYWGGVINVKSRDKLEVTIDGQRKLIYGKNRTQLGKNVDIIKFHQNAGHPFDNTISFTNVAQQVTINNTSANGGTVHENHKNGLYLSLYTDSHTADPLDRLDLNRFLKITKTTTGNGSIDLSVKLEKKDGAPTLENGMSQAISGLTQEQKLKLKFYEKIYETTEAGNKKDTLSEVYSMTPRDVLATTAATEIPKDKKKEVVVNNTVAIDSVPAMFRALDLINTSMTSVLYNRLNANTLRFSKKKKYKYSSIAHLERYADARDVTEVRGRVSPAMMSDETPKVRAVRGGQLEYKNTTPSSLLWIDVGYQRAEVSNMLGGHMFNVMVGIDDFILDGWLIGAFAGVNVLKFKNLKHNFFEHNSVNPIAGLYTRITLLDFLEFGLSGGYTLGRSSYKNQIILAGMYMHTNEAKYTHHMLFAHADAGILISFADGFTLKPFGSYSMSYMGGIKFKESGPIPSSYQTQDMISSYVGLGLEFRYVLIEGSYVYIRPEYSFQIESKVKAKSNVKGCIYSNETLGINEHINNCANTKNSFVDIQVGTNINIGERYALSMAGNYRRSSSIQMYGGNLGIKVMF